MPRHLIIERLQLLTSFPMPPDPASSPIFKLPHITFPTWHEIITFLGDTDGWIFRGQEDYAEHPLQTSLERAAALLKEDALTIERRILRDFKRRAFLSGEPFLPLNDDILQWLALLQHHGAPTRLLDFSHSFYVALFFAINRMERDSVIWCIRTSALSPRLASPWSGDKNHVLKMILEDEPAPSNVPFAVMKDEPFHLNRRLALQQGCFLIPLNTSGTFGDNLKSNETGLGLGHDPWIKTLPDFTAKTNVFKILIPLNQHAGIRKQLRKMNLTSEHLFPGLDGIASSYWQ